MPHEQAQVELGLDARADADDDDAAVRGERLEVPGDVRRADELEDDVERAVLLEALRIEDPLGAQLGDRRVVVVVADRGGHARPGGPAELHAGRPDAARGAAHEQPLAGAQARLGEQRVVGGREGLGHAARRIPLQDAGTGMSWRSWTVASSAWPAPPAMPMTRSPTAKRVAPGPSSATSPASSRPGMSAGIPGGGG